MAVMDFLQRNSFLFPNDTALIEINPAYHSRSSWKEFNLIQPNRFQIFRRHFSWQVFNEKANRCANFLISHDVKKGDKIAVILYNCIDWLPIYFGILKTGAIAVPFKIAASSFSAAARFALPSA